MSQVKFVDLTEIYILYHVPVFFFWGGDIKI